MGRHSADRHVGNVQDNGARAVDDREDMHAQVALLAEAIDQEGVER
jgi:hypothetical protein